MSSTPKWYCRTKPTTFCAFSEFTKLAHDLRRVVKRVILDVKLEIFNERENSLEECEKVIDLYWSLKNQNKRKDIIILKNKTKHNPYTSTLVYKFDCIEELNDRRFHQLVYALKKLTDELLRKSLHSEVWLNWALQIVYLYNKCCDNMAKTQSDLNTEFNPNICSNMYPSLLLSNKPFDCDYVLKLASESRMEQNSLELLLSLYKMRERNSKQKSDSNSSSLEISRILTNGLIINNVGESKTQINNDIAFIQSAAGPEDRSGRSLSHEYTLKLLNFERAFISQIIMKANEICPTIFGLKENFDLNKLLVCGMRSVWSHISIILDHIILWWMETPLSCFSLDHAGSVRDWIRNFSINDIPEPVFSTFRGLSEILTNFLAIHIWDKQFRLTLSPLSLNQGEQPKERAYKRGDVEGFEVKLSNQYAGTDSGIVWLNVFSHLIQQINSFCPISEFENISLVPIAEQIAILHRIDHSVHSARLWVREQAKILCSAWKIEILFRILEYDVKQCLELFSTLKLPQLVAGSCDILMLVCVTLRAKLNYEVNINIDKMRKTTDECIDIMSAVCRTLSMANFKLSFPSKEYWYKQNPRIAQDDRDSNLYVDFVLNAVYLPAIKATRDIRILELILKIICQAWLDYIYEERFQFSLAGANKLHEDFDKVREWLINCEQLRSDYAQKLGDHEVLRMCKGVGKILLRKPDDIIMIKQSGTYRKISANDPIETETQLPPEMFVSNQKNWLKLRASGSGSVFSWLQFCCDDTTF